jgi:hypothetical protein
MDELNHPCQFCQVRNVAMTLRDTTGQYHTCHVCAIQFGIEVQAVNVACARDAELAKLEQWAKVEWPVNR